MKHEELFANMVAMRDQAIAAIEAIVRAAEDETVDLFLSANRYDEEYEDEWDELPDFAYVSKHFRHHPCKVLCLVGRDNRSNNGMIEVLGLDDDDSIREKLLNDLSLPELIDILRWLETNNDIFERP